MFDTPEHLMEINDAEGTHKLTAFAAIFGFIQLDKVPEVDAEGLGNVKSVDAVCCM